MKKTEKTLTDHIKVFILLLIVLAVVFSVFSKGPFKFDVDEISGSAVKQINTGSTNSEIFIYVFLIIGIVLAFFYKSEISHIFEEKGKVKKHLVVYIKKGRKQGFSDRKIKQRLLEQGWDIIDLDTTFSRFKK